MKTDGIIISSSNDIRRAFCDYFISKGHTPVESSSLIPHKDQTLLFTNAGMVQFKGLFLGEERRNYKRAVSVQKCLRAGGKHNDLENVGLTGRHHTFFEMLGNFSFGDYFKEEAIEFGWEFLTEVIGLPKDLLWITIFREDEEAAGIWRKKIGIKSERIVRLGEKDNFWQMGDIGPSGPCSEILVDQGEEVGCGRPTCAAGCDCDRYLELWNLVFMQYDRDKEGRLNPLPKPSIDTGMGLERISAVCQGVYSNYESDLFAPIISAISDLSERSYGEEGKGDFSIRIIADHLRAIAFLISDGVLPSNEGRGYVLRRIIRRGARHGRLLGIQDPFLFKLSNVVIDIMKHAYPEILKSRERIGNVTVGEEERFLDTLDQGIRILGEIIQELRAKGRDMIPGDTLFKLYDTYGLPIDLIQDIVREEGISLDEPGFKSAMEEQRHRARMAGGFKMEKGDPQYTKIINDYGETNFIGYDYLEADMQLVSIIKRGKDEEIHEGSGPPDIIKSARVGDEVELIFNQTPFYGESGGQVGDRGEISADGVQVEITDTVRPIEGLFVHKGRVVKGQLRTDERYHAAVSARARLNTARNHTATHLLHAALREVLGDHVRQGGSLVSPERLRFDFTHFSPLKREEIDRIEMLVNERIMTNTKVVSEIMGAEEAINSGAMALFGEKYGDKVRVVSISDFSRELCGGTHCKVTGEIGLFKLLHESSIASGVRRIEAVTGDEAYRVIKREEETLNGIAELFKASPQDLTSKAKRLLSSLKEKEKEIERLKGELSSKKTVNIEDKVRSIGGIRVFADKIDSMGMDDLRLFGDSIRGKLKSGIILVGSVTNGTASIVIMVTKDLTERFKANEIIREIAPVIGGGGGGRDDIAQAGGRNTEKLDEAMGKIYEVIEKRL
ncbi:MAG: alanine--tRNA ligase [Nitrospirae bacterium]|nr:alanine--tRNA ligase [Nitrospirota bacterium]